MGTSTLLLLEIFAVTTCCPMAMAIIVMGSYRDDIVYLNIKYRIRICNILIKYIYTSYNIHHYNILFLILNT